MTKKKTTSRKKTTRKKAGKKKRKAPQNAWTRHLKKVRKENPNLALGAAMKKAAKSYKKK